MSMTVGQLKKRLESYPDDMEVIVEHMRGLVDRQLCSTSEEATTVTHVCLTTSHSTDVNAVGQMRRCHNRGCPTAKDAFRIA